MKKIKNFKFTIFYLLIFSVSFTLFSFNFSTGIKYKMMNKGVIKRMDDGALYLKGKINLKFKNQINTFGQKTFGIQKLDELISRFNPSEVKQIYPLSKLTKHLIGDDELTRIFSVNYDYDFDPGELSNKIFDENKDILEWAEPDYVYESDYTPNDPSIGSQWFLNKISAYLAWDLNKGDTNIIIGMIDTGSDLDHPDLTANIKRNWAENPTNAFDDDNNGYVDDWIGWDFAGGPNVPPTGEDNDPQIYGSNCDHGSHTSGCASEVSNNAIGGAGIGFKCKLLICKHGADNDYTGGGVSYLYNTNNGIMYAYQNGAKVINCSFGGTTSSSYTQNLVNTAFANGSIVVASAGNDGANVARYPASYNNVISVAATTSSDTKAYFSNYHSTVDLCAPGVSIYATLWNNTYAYYDGTSMSAPIVSGVVALIWSKAPAGYTATQVVTKLLAGVDNIYGINPGYVGLLGSGRVNAYMCVQGLTGISNNNSIPSEYKLLQNYPNPFNPTTKVVVDIPKRSNVKLTVYDVSGKEIATLINENKEAGSYTYVFDASPLSSGIYFYKLKAGDFTDTKKMILVK
jgi:serine protease